ncbi:MAG: alkylmercury lyase [candidate division KSB1 bacterium]|nr:alkylmercury lyase [candidate division KSB1 bacterium]
MPRKQSRIEFQYIPGCPHAEATLDNLRRLVCEGLISEQKLVITTAEDSCLSPRGVFAGSPSVLVDGVDVYTEAEPQGNLYACRVYSLQGHQSGVLPLEFLRAQIVKLRGRTTHEQ